MSQKSETQSTCPILDPRDAEYINSMEDLSEREKATAAVTTFRRPDRLRAGDEVPELVLLDLSDLFSRPLRAKAGRPLVLFFGSYT